MAALTMQRDLVVELKKETVLNIGILSKLHGMPPDVSRQVLKDNALEKPTQNLFNHISHYFMEIIDPKAAEALPWPLYDSKSERTYRNELANFISNYSNKGLLAPVMTSYLVNPNCYKVILLLFQMSQLSIHKLLETKINKESQKKLCNEMTAKYKSQDKDAFIEQIENETQLMLSKFSNYLHKRRATEKIAEKIRTKVVEIESKLSSVNAQKFLDGLIDNFISKHELDSTTKEEILKIKNVHKQSLFFEWWLKDLDEKIDEIESKWSEKMTPFTQICQETQTSTEALIDRHIGQAEKQTYMIEYNHKTDEICTDELQNQVNSQQKFILKNIIKEEKLNFPNLIRGFLIAISFVLRNAEVGDEIYNFNEYLEGGKRNYSEVVKALRDLVKRIYKAETQLELSPITFHEDSIKCLPDIPPLPGLSDISCTREQTYQALFDSFTPMSLSKNQFNLWRRTTLHTFIRPQPKSLLTPFQAPKDDFLKSLASHRANSDLNATQNFHNMSIIHKPGRVNETISSSSTGCTKEQLLRLLSTKKTSSSKKHKHSMERSMKFKKAKLFTESMSTYESNGLIRSHSSPNLFENREIRSIQRSGRRKLSIMQEGSPLLELSGIVAIDRDSSCEKSNLGSLTKNKIPVIQVTTETPPNDTKLHTNLNNFNVDLNKEFLIENSPEVFATVVTPQNTTKQPTKTNSLEKIINRFKNIKARNTYHENCNEKSNDFHTIVEEKENFFIANKLLLPDLLSPSCSVGGNTDESVEDRRKPRESLGTALGVDHTFLDQFDLID